MNSPYSNILSTGTSTQPSLQVQNLYANALNPTALSEMGDKFGNCV